MPKTQTMRKTQAQKVQAQVKTMKKYEEKSKEKYDEKYFEEFKKCFNKVLEADEWRSKKEGDSYKPNEARDKIKELLSLRGKHGTDQKNFTGP